MTHAFTVSVPATSANLGPGFDSFGLALDWHNHFHFSPADSDLITSETPGVPTLAEDNMVFQALEHVFTKSNSKRPSLHLHIDAELPLARGLGSSSTAIVAGITAANYMLGQPFSDQTLAQIATELEGHPDNVVPALMGGVRLCDENHFLELPWPSDWGILVIVPPYPVRTDDARRVLPAHPSREDAIFNLRRSAFLTYALCQGDSDIFKASLDDKIHQPYRGQLIAEWPDVQTLAKEADAFGAIISGSGPTMAVFYPKASEASVLNHFETWGKQHPDIIIRAMSLDHQGARIRLAE